MSRLFHALVVVGAGVSTAHCGSRLIDTGDFGASGTGGGTKDGDGTPKGAGGVGPSAGGSTNTGVGAAGTIVAGGGGGQGGGGSAGTGGIPFVPEGGDATQGLPDGPTVGQWDCSGSACATRPTSIGLAGVLTPREACPVDPSRPRGPNDCASNEFFECRAAEWTDGASIAVNCQCVPTVPVGDCNACEPLPGQRGLLNPISCVFPRKLCPCTAYTGILIK
jgi:hypothetical protein